MRQHIDTVAWLHIGLGIVGLLIAFTAGAILSLAGVLSGSGESAAILVVVATFVVGFLALLSVPHLVGGWALLKRKAWARPMVLILSFLNLLNFPLGTFIGGFSIWVLMDDESRVLLAGAEPHQAPRR